MTNEELNKKVHELRGEHFHNFQSCRERDGFWVWTCECGKIYAHVSVRKSTNWGNKDYPGNIKDACEAVRSIPESKRNAFGFEIAQKFNVLGSWPNIIYHLLSDEDAPRKICLAYIEVMG